ncbi:hypothetical protein [Ekhidna sp. To15]|uniref:hypothetical protein n=1 Tax=Ekhidna sp. To15 TaxID=3395267 RepID=UPI003F526FB1
MKCKFLLLLIFISPFVFSTKAISQSFEGRLAYINYQVIEGDTITSSYLNYWVKEDLYKHAGYVPKMPFVDLGTLYADADKMIKTNVNNAGEVDRTPINLDWEAPSLKVEAMNKVDSILGFQCQLWKLIDLESEKVISTLWITEDINSEYFDQLVELFEYKNTLFPCIGINGWILRRVDYRREGKTFVTEIEEVERMKLNISEMVVY